MLAERRRIVNRSGPLRTDRSQFGPSKRLSGERRDQTVDQASELAARDRGRVDLGDDQAAGLAAGEETSDRRGLRPAQPHLQRPPNPQSRSRNSFAQHGAQVSKHLSDGPLGSVLVGSAGWDQTWPSSPPWCRCAPARILSRSFTRARAPRGPLRINSSSPRSCSSTSRWVWRGTPSRRSGLTVHDRTWFHPTRCSRSAQRRCQRRPADWPISRRRRARRDFPGGFPAPVWYVDRRFALG